MSKMNLSKQDVKDIITYLKYYDRIITEKCKINVENDYSIKEIDEAIEEHNNILSIIETLEY